MFKALVFDMDGTIADLYGVEGWLNDLRAENVRPYRDARPMYDMNAMRIRLMELKNNGWTIIVTTWLSKDAPKAYKKETTKTKKAWLDAVDFPYDEFHAVRYGATKADSTRKHGGFQILIDDNKKVRDGWHLGSTFDANGNVMDFLTDLYRNGLTIPA